jgi:sulfite reductase alpha subunit-like flavoprotein
LVKKKNEKTLGEWLLFFGCRNESKDFIYKDEMTQAQEDGVIDLNVAFSRDGKVKVYVQDLLQNEETGKRVWDLLSKKKGMFYVCGGTLMGRAVKNAVIELAQTYGGLTEPKAKGWVKKQQDQHRYIQELWS